MNHEAAAFSEPSLPLSQLLLSRDKTRQPAAAQESQECGLGKQRSPNRSFNEISALAFFGEDGLTAHIPEAGPRHARSLRANMAERQRGFTPHERNETDECDAT